MRSESGSGFERALQKYASFDPIPLYGSHSDAEGFGGFRFGEAAEKPALDHFGEPRRPLGQALERLVQLEDYLGLIVRARILLVECYVTRRSSALESSALPSAVDDDLSHCQ
jgi:hypothetical protein